MPKDFYSTTEAARILRISRIEAFRKIKAGKIKATKVGRNYIIPHDALLEALGKVVGSEKKKAIEKTIDRALREYGETFRLLGRE